MQSLTLEQAEKLAMATLKQVMEEKINATNVEIAVIPTATRKFTIYPREKVEQILASL